MYSSRATTVLEVMGVVIPLEARKHQMSREVDIFLADCGVQDQRTLIHGFIQPDGKSQAGSCCRHVQRQPGSVATNFHLQR